jgi:hypothetical protein
VSERSPPLAWVLQVRAELAALEKPLRERGLAALSLFVFLARGAARHGSDVDVIVQIAPNTRFGLIELVSVKDFLEDRLVRRVDVVTRGPSARPCGTGSFVRRRLVF